MPLSDHEKKTLAEMEAALAAEDPRLVTTLTATVRTPRALSFLRGAIFFAIGMIAVLIGLIAKIPLISIGGFLFAVYGVFGAITRSSHSGARFGSGKSGKTGGRGKGKKQGNFSDRLQRRWEERN